MLTILDTDNALSWMLLEAAVRIWYILADIHTQLQVTIFRHIVSCFWQDPPAYCVTKNEDFYEEWTFSCNISNGHSLSQTCLRVEPIWNMTILIWEAISWICNLAQCLQMTVSCIMYESRNWPSTLHQHCYGWAGEVSREQGLFVSKYFLLARKVLATILWKEFYFVMEWWANMSDLFKNW